MKIRIALVCITVAMATSALVLQAHAAGKWAWKCYETGCGKAVWNGGYPNRDAANSAGKNHEVATKGHRWDLKGE